MEYKNDEIPVKFTLPDHPTVRLVLEYDTRWELDPEGPIYVRLWEAARAVIADWECPHVDLKVSLDDVGSREAIEAIKWASLATFGHFRQLNEIPKNS